MVGYVKGLDFASGEIVGDRKGQEDYHAFLLCNNGTELLAILADGMGGHEAGEIASRKAVEAFAHCFKTHPASSVSARLGAALEVANAELAQSISQDPGLSGMGCTLLAAHFSDHGVHWISVGDSPLFIVRGGKIRQLNEDHSMAPEIELRRKSGKISDEEAINHPHRNALRSALMGDGTPSMIDSPAKPFLPRAGDVILLASDGLQTLSDTEICKVTRRDGRSQAIVSNLLGAVQAKARRNQDNATVQVILPKTQGNKQRRPVRSVVLVLMILAALTAGLLILERALLGSKGLESWFGKTAASGLRSTFSQKSGASGGST